MQSYAAKKEVKFQSKFQNPVEINMLVIKNRQLNLKKINFKGKDLLIPYNIF